MTKIKWHVLVKVNGEVVENAEGFARVNKINTMKALATKHPLGCEIWATESNAKAWAVFERAQGSLNRLRSEPK